MKIFFGLCRDSKMTQRILLLFILSSSIVGCSQKFQDVGVTVEQSVWGAEDVVVADERLQKLPYASLYARVAQGPQIHMVLAYADTLSGQSSVELKWVAQGRAMIVTEGGRITKTLAMPVNNLAEVTTQQYPFGSDTPVSWQATYDWQPGYRYGYKATITRRLIGSESVDTPLQQFTTNHYIETVYFQVLDTGFENHFWVDRDGRVIKTIQHIGPDMSSIELLLIRDFG
ncbi:YjbF family lipoprotein [Vibrio breoganii]